MKIKPWFQIAILVALAVLLMLSVQKCGQNKSAYEETLTMLDRTETEFMEFKTTSGLNAANAKLQVGTLEAVIAANRLQIARLEKELKLKPRAIKELINVYLEGEDSVVLKRDTTYVNVESTPEAPTPFVYEDEWNSFQAFVSGDEIGLLYSISDSIALVTTYDNGGLFKKGSTTITAVSSNPAITIKGLSSTKVAEKKKNRWWVPVVAVGVGIAIGAKAF